MRILEFDKKHGLLRLKIETPDDLYVLYHFLQRGDLVKATTTRKIKTESDVDRIPMKLTIAVEKVSFHEFSERLRISGIIVEGPEKFVSLGSHHTLNVKVGDVIEIVRREGFTEEELEPLREAEARSSAGNMILVAIEEGYSTVALLTPYGVRTFATISKNVVKGHEYESSLKAFLSEVLSAVRNLIEQSRPIAVIVAGPGFTKEKFAELLKREIRGGIQIIVDSVTSGTFAGIHEMLRRGLPQRAVEKHRVSVESQAVEEFLYHVARKDGLAVYGIDPVRRAAEWGVAEKILISMGLLNTVDKATRNRVLEIIRLGKKNKSEIILISTMHPSGKQFALLGGIAAILRYPVEVDSDDIASGGS